jgi:hypothetical protein
LKEFSGESGSGLRFRQKRLDKLVPLFVRAQLQEGLALTRSNDVSSILLQPIPAGIAQFPRGFLILLVSFFVALWWLSLEDACCE